MPLTRGRSIRFGGYLHRDSNEAAPSGAASTFPAVFPRRSRGRRVATTAQGAPHGRIDFRPRATRHHRPMSEEPRIERPAPPPGQPDSREEVDPDVAELLGLRPADAGSFPTADELDDRGVMTDTAVYEGELEARTPTSDAADGERVRLEPLAADEARAGETETPDEAAEEGLTWIPPSDPPIRPEVG